MVTVDDQVFESLVLTENPWPSRTLKTSEVHPYLRSIGAGSELAAEVLNRVAEPEVLSPASREAIVRVAPVLGVQTDVMRLFLDQLCDSLS